MKTFTLKTALKSSEPKTPHPESAAAKSGKPKHRYPHKIIVGPGGVEVKREWLLVDAKDKILGRLASQVANLLRGKHKPTFTPSMDMGDFVVVVNASAIKLTGNKATEKLAYRHSGYPGGLKSTTYGQLREQNPAHMVWLAVKRMLPRNKLRFKYLRKLKVYAGPTHPHTAQQPKPIAIL